MLFQKNALTNHAGSASPMHCSKCLQKRKPAKPSCLACLIHHRLRGGPQLAAAAAEAALPAPQHCGMPAQSPRCCRKVCKCSAIGENSCPVKRLKAM